MIITTLSSRERAESISEGLTTPWSLDDCSKRAMYIHSRSGGLNLANAKAKKPARKPYTSSDVKLLRQYSKERTSIENRETDEKNRRIAEAQKALKLGVGLGHQR
jgi:hypothetical protein